MDIDRYVKVITMILKEMDESDERFLIQIITLMQEHLQKTGRL